VRVVDGAAVRDVQAPEPDPVARADRGAHGAGLGGERVAEAGRPGEPELDVAQADAGGDGHAVPLVEPVEGDLVAGRLERHDRELVVGDLGLLQRHGVDVGRAEPLDDPFEPGAQGVDVPRGQPHVRDPRPRR
jgi:hypothetical protein